MKKNIVEKLLPGYILAFVASFMCIIYEPLIMYATNINEFWFDIYILFKENILWFFCAFLLLSIAYTILFFIDKIFCKKSMLLNIFYVLFLGAFFICYIQGNFLVGDLPSLDGEEIIWNNYYFSNIISIVLCSGIFIVLFVLIRKFKFKKVISISKYIVLGIFGMLFVSLITTLITTEEVFDSKNAAFITNENFDIYSNDENFIIFVVDTVDSMEFKELIETNKEYSYIFQDFTYYPDTLAAYPYTKNAIPFILSGIWNENETTYQQYYNKAMNESKLINTLVDEKYNLNIYEPDFIWTEKKVSNISNVKLIENKVNKKSFVIQEAKYILFKYLPFPCKKYSKIESMDFDKGRMTTKEKGYTFSNKYVYNLINNMSIKKVDEKQFKFIHVEGAHPPFNYDKNVNKIENGKREQKLEATITIINSYLEKLKKEGVYDNSNIIIMSDHGYNSINYVERKNPILFIKGIGEEHEMYESDLPISFEDLSDAYLDLLKGKNSQELFSGIEKDRVRRYLFYRFNFENSIIEYEQKGKAWDKNSLIKTDKEFNR